MWIIGNKCANSLSLPEQVVESSADIYLVGEPSAPWKSSLTRRGQCWELTMSAHRTDGNEFGFSEKFLTLTASDARRSLIKPESLRKRYIKHPQGNLADFFHAIDFDIYAEIQIALRRER